MTDNKLLNEQIDMLLKSNDEQNVKFKLDLIKTKNESEKIIKELKKNHQSKCQDK
jgi:uncharacterized SAM-dependent methyltransferase